MKYYRITDIKSLVEFVNREAIRAAKRFDSPFEGDLDHIKSLILYSHPWAVTKISDKNPLILSENDVKVSLCLDYVNGKTAASIQEVSYNQRASYICNTLEDVVRSLVRKVEQTFDKSEDNAKAIVSVMMANTSPTYPCLEPALKVEVNPLNGLPVLSYACEACDIEDFKV